MKEWLKELFSESGNASLTRVLTAQVVIVSLLLAVASAIWGKPSDALILGLLGIGFGGKILNKANERK